MDAMEKRGPGRPSTAAPFGNFVVSALVAEPGIDSGSLLRRARVGGYVGGKSAFFSLVAKLRDQHGIVSAAEQRAARVAQRRRERDQERAERAERIARWAAEAKQRKAEKARAREERTAAVERAREERTRERRQKNEAAPFGVIGPPPGDAQPGAIHAIGGLLASAGVRPEVQAAIQVLLGTGDTGTQGGGPVTLGQAWGQYLEVVGPRIRAIETDGGRMKHLRRILGRDRQLSTLTLVDLDRYRLARRTEVTIRKTTPSVATLNREVELLARVVTFALSRRLLSTNPIAGFQYEQEHNIREVVVDEELFELVLAACPGWLQAFVLVAFDSGGRRKELTMLRWTDLDEEQGIMRLQTDNTKTRRGRETILSERARLAIGKLPRHSQFVFANRFGDHYDLGYVSQKFRLAMMEADIRDGSGRRPVLHDLRRSFVTLARRSGIPETVVMKLSGHQTTSVFRRYSIAGREDILEARRVLAGSHRVSVPMSLRKAENDNNDGVA